MGTSGTTSTATLKITTTKIGKVLADSKGDTLYFYSKDMKGGPSTCTGACLSAWPAVTGTPAAAMGVTFAGKLGSVKDANGTVQATYNGYPLYTYAQDMAPGDATGNGVGGVWHVISGQYLTSSMTSGSASTGSSSSGSSGYGSGYGTGTKLSSSSSSGSSAGSAAQNSTTSGSSGSGSSGSSGSTGSTGGSGSNYGSPTPAPTSSINGGGCGEGSCW